MKKISIMAKGVMIAMGMIGIAHADNNNWTGFYAGVDAGFAFNDVQLTSQQLGFTSPSESCNQNSDFSTLYFFVDYGNAINFDIPIVYGLYDPNGNANVKSNSNNIVLAINYWV